MRKKKIKAVHCHLQQEGLVSPLVPGSYPQEEAFRVIEVVEKALQLKSDPEMMRWQAKGIGLFGLWRKLPDGISVLGAIMQNQGLSDDQKVVMLKQVWKEKKSSYLRNAPAFFGMRDQAVQDVYDQIDHVLSGEGCGYGPIGRYA